MSKRIFIIILMLCVMCSTSALGNDHIKQGIYPIPSEEIAIGGIPLFSTRDYVRNIYGTPDVMKITYSRMLDSDVETWDYGGSFILTFVGNGAESIICKAANGLKTPAGIGVGSSESKVREVYGGVRKGSFYTYRSELGTELGIIVENGIVKEIRAIYPY